MRKIKSLSLAFFTCSSVYSAPTDCIQVASDGEVNSTKATSVFTRGQTAPKFDTFECLVNEIVHIICFIGTYQLLQTMAHEMLHINQNTIFRLRDQMFGMNHPLGLLHNHLDIYADKLITQEYKINMKK